MSNAEDLPGKLKFFAWLFQFERSLFAVSDFTDAALRLVNDTQIVLLFSTAALIEITDQKTVVLAQFGQTAVNEYSRLVQLYCKLARSRKWDDVQDLSAQNGLEEELSSKGRHYYCIPLKPVGKWMQNKSRFLLLLEYPGPIPDQAVLSSKILALSAADALYSLRNAKRKMAFPEKIRKKWSLLAILILLAALAFIPVPDGAVAEFTLKSPETTSVYAWFDGPIAQCLKQDGELVRKGDVIAKYDVNQLQYRFDVVQGQLRELNAELALEQQNSFSNEARLGKVQLLKAKLKTLQVSETEAKWYLDHSVLRAPAEGILVLADGRAEKLAGKAVRTGDKIFEIMGQQGMNAEIALQEKDAILLNSLKDVKLYLYAAPEKTIPARILEISKYPELTEQHTFCYHIRTEIRPSKEYRFGMRGIAKLSGDSVPLVYHLFKDIVLYFRWL